MPHPIEEAILDKSLTDEDVYDFIMSSPDDTPKRGNQTQKEWERQMESYGQTLEHLGNLASQHRPRVLERIIKEVAEEHLGCCGDGTIH